MARTYLALLVLAALIEQLEHDEKMRMNALGLAQGTFRLLYPYAFALDPSG